MRKLLTGFIAGALIISVFTIVKYYYSYTFAESNAGLGGLKNNYCDILFIGSSQSRQDYNVKIIDSLTGLSSYCLAYNGLQPALAFEVIENILSKKIKPSIIIMEAFPYLSVQQSQLADIRLFSDAEPDLKKQILTSLEKNSSFDLRKKAELMVRNGNENLIMYPFTISKRNSLSYKGSYQNKIISGMETEFTLQTNTRNTAEKLNDLQVQANKNIIELGNKHGIKIIFVQPPVAAPVQYSANYQNASLQLKEIINFANAEYIHVKNGFSTFDPSNFADHFHLSTRGRDNYSDLIGKELKKMLNESR